tara:strand:+ start:11138 stop:11341 length:204 start_codon:yes stop_codon:yes gene_type:complete
MLKHINNAQDEKARCLSVYEGSGKRLAGMTKRELVAHADLAANQLLSKGHPLAASYIKAINNHLRES